MVAQGAAAGIYLRDIKVLFRHVEGEREVAKRIFLVQRSEVQKVRAVLVDEGLFHVFSRNFYQFGISRNVYQFGQHFQYFTVIVW